MCKQEKRVRNRFASLVVAADNSELPPSSDVSGAAPAPCQTLPAAPPPSPPSSGLSAAHPPAPSSGPDKSPFPK